MSAEGFALPAAERRGEPSAVARRAAACAGAGDRRDIPNIDHRYGDGRAEMIGIAVLDERGRALHMLEPSSRIVVRISVRARKTVPMPMVGFMLRNQLGMDFSGTNTAREGYELRAHAGRRHLHRGFPCRAAGAVSRVVFLFAGHRRRDAGGLPDVRLDRQRGGVADEPRGRRVYGYIHLPCRVEVNARLRRGRRTAPRCWRNTLAEFTGERVIPGEVDVDLLNEHMARYTFAARLARGKRVLDAGCGAGYGSAELARGGADGGWRGSARRKPSNSRARTTRCPT